MRGGLFKAPKNKKYAPHTKTVKDVEHQLLSGGKGLKIPRLTPTGSTDINLAMVLDRQGRGGQSLLGSQIDYTLLRKMEADLSGLPQGRTAGTIPERLVGSWLLKHKYPYGGMGYNYDWVGWGFQVPILGGKANSGSVADIYISPALANNEMGTVIRVNGAYWHSQLGQSVKDAAKKMQMVAYGYTVADIWDYEVLQPGVLSNKLRQILGL